MGNELKQSETRWTRGFPRCLLRPGGGPGSVPPQLGKKKRLGKENGALR